MLNYIHSTEFFYLILLWLTSWYTFPKQGEIFTEKELRKKFDVRAYGGIRPTHKNKAIILVQSYASETQGNYQNYIDEKNGIIIHTGHGTKDQSLRYFNKSLAESKQNGYALLCFDKRTPNEIRFMHKAKYMSHEYITEKNSQGTERKVIKFRLKIIDSE